MNKVYYKILLLLIFFISLFLISYEYDVKAEKMPKLLEKVIITIDPGHGGISLAQNMNDYKCK